MWSLNYEAWYYLILAVWLSTSGRFRYLFAAVTCLAAGPKIVTMLPIWLAGVWLYRWRPTIPRSAALSWLKTITAYQAYRLGPSTGVLSDYLVTLLTRSVAVPLAFFVHPIASSM